MKQFAAIASAQPVRTVSVYRLPAGVTHYCVADLRFEGRDGEILLPDFLGRQLELVRLRRHVATHFEVVDGRIVLRCSDRLEAAIADAHAELVRAVVAELPPAPAPATEPASDGQHDAADASTETSTAAAIAAPTVSQPAGKHKRRGRR